MALPTPKTQTKWNPYMKSVSEKLKRDWKGFEDMTNEIIKPREH